MKFCIAHDKLAIVARGEQDQLGKKEFGRSHS